MAEPSESGSLRYATSVIAIAVFFTLCVAGLVVAFVYATDIFLLLFLAILFAVFLTRTSAWVAGHTPLGYGWSLGLVTTLLVIFLLGGLLLFGVQVSSQFSKARQHLDEGQQRLRELVSEYPTLKSMVQSTPYVRTVLEDDASQGSQAESGGQQPSGESGKSESEGASNGEDANQTSAPSSSSGLSALQPAAQKAASVVTGIFKTTFGLVVNSLLIFFVGLFIATSPGMYRDGVVVLFPPPRRPRVRDILNQMGDALWNWLVGRFGSMLVTGVGAGVLLGILGVPMAISLGIVTGLLTFIPNIGGLIALLLGILFALPKGGTVVLLVVLGYFALQLIESYVVTPLIQQKQVSLPPALLIGFQAVMGILFGFLGAAVASPLLAAAKVGIEVAYIKDVLERDEDD